MDPQAVAAAAGDDLWTPHLPAVYRVGAKVQETADTWTLSLAPADPHAEARPFAPGQFHMLTAFGVGEAPISISGDPDHPERSVHTIRAVGAVSRALCALRPGEPLGLRGPFGRPWPVVDPAPTPSPASPDLLLVAGGIGLAPLRPVLYHALNHRAAYGRVALVVGARTPSDLLFTDELARWAARADLQVLVTVDAATAEWTGHVGVVTTLLGRIACDPGRALAFTCGPEIMMRFAAQGLRERGVAPERIYLSLERNMKCAVGLCGRCQLGSRFVCQDGPVFAQPEAARLIAVRGL